MVALRAPDLEQWTCSRCTTSKPLDAYPRDRSRKNGRATTCKDCQSRRLFTWRHETGRSRRLASEMGRWDAEGRLRCARCREHKPLTEYWHRAAGTGKMAYCKPCQAASQRDWRAGRPESYEAHKARLRQRRADRVHALAHGFSSVEAWRAWCVEDARAEVRDLLIDRALDELQLLPNGHFALGGYE